MTVYPETVRIVEVGPRDGLQNEPDTVPTDAKVRYIEMLADSGLKSIEATSFVNPKRVPQLADAEQVFAALKPRPGVSYSALVPNMRGLQRSIAAGVREIALFTAASETFSQNNTGMSIADSIHEFVAIIPLARAAGMRVRVYVSTAFHCPFEGRIEPDPVRALVGRILDMDVDEISIGDTIGHASPTDVERLLAALSPALPLAKTACHFHDTRGSALANVLTALRAGVAIFDSSSGGLGGCPFAPGAAGNLATEDLCLMLDGMGIQTGVDVARVADASGFLAGVLGRELPGKALQSLNPPTC